MKLNIKPAVFFRMMILGAVVIVAGCATTSIQRSAKTGSTMETVERDIQQAIGQVNATDAALQELINPGQPDAKKAFKKYSANVEKMESQGKLMFDHADKMSAMGKAYFEEWRTEGSTYTNPEIQALSEQRRANLNSIFVKISEASIGVKGAFNAYMSDIRDIRTYLANDLTPKGIEGITPIAQKAMSDGGGLKEAIAPVLSAIGNARAELAQGGAK